MPDPSHFWEKKDPITGLIAGFSTAVHDSWQEEPTRKVQISLMNDRGHQISMFMVNVPESIQGNIAVAAYGITAHEQGMLHNNREPFQARRIKTETVFVDEIRLRSLTPIKYAHITPHLPPLEPTVQAEIVRALAVS